MFMPPLSFSIRPILDGVYHNMSLPGGGGRPDLKEGAACYKTSTRRPWAVHGVGQPPKQNLAAGPVHNILSDFLRPSLFLSD